jgi:ABC-type nitrate/sulfonate/bicarbonate transport system substrate-binding protein
MAKTLETLAYTRCPVPTSLGIAIQQGWFQEAVAGLGTKVESIRESASEAVRESHFDHSVRNSVRHGGNIPAIGARSAGAETRVIGLSWADEVQLILAQPQSGIKTVKDLKGRRFGLPNWKTVKVDFSRAQALRALENALSLEGLSVKDVEIVDFDIVDSRSDAQGKTIAGTLFSQRSGGGRNQNAEVIGLLRDEVDAIFLKGVHGARTAYDFGLVTVIDTGSHPEPLIRSNNGTPRTLTVDADLIENHFDIAVTIVEQALRAEAWARQHPEETRRYLARETNSSEFWTHAAYSENAHLRLKTDLAEQSAHALQDFSDFLHRWNFIPNPVDVRSWIDIRPFEAADRRKIAV